MSDSLLAPPDGDLRNRFGTAIFAELSAHPHLGVMAGVLLVLVVVGRLTLSGSGRKRLGTWQGMLVFCGVTAIARAELLALGVRDGAYSWLALGGAIALVLGLIGVTMLLLFELGDRWIGVPRLVRDIGTVVACAIGLVVVLSRAGVNLLQLVTTSAIVTAVVGLSLQDTLGNILAGVALQMDDSVKVGDWIRVDDRAAGRVREVRWRATVIETRDGDIVNIPNALVNRGVLTQLNAEGLEHRQVVPFDLSLDLAPNRIIEIVLQAVVGTPNVSTTTPPDCVLVSFEQSSARYAVRYRLIDVRPDTPTDSEVRKRIWYALHRNGMSLAVPLSQVEISQQGAEQARERTARDIRRRMRVLERIPLFGPLGEEGRRQLAEGLTFAPYAKGETILTQGAAGDSLFIVRSGRVGVRISSEGQSRELAQLGSGDFFGEMSLFTGEARRATIDALEDTDCYIVERTLFEQLLKSNPSVIDELSRLLAERQVALEQRRADLAANARTPATHADLLARIRGFFGVG